MNALVQFTDDTYYICKSTEIIFSRANRDGLCSVKYRGQRYEARVVVFDDSTVLLNKMKDTLEAKACNLQLDQVHVQPPVHEAPLDTIDGIEGNDASNTTYKLDLNSSGNLDMNIQYIHLENGLAREMSNLITKTPHGLSQPESTFSFNIENGIDKELPCLSASTLQELEISFEASTDVSHNSTPLEYTDKVESSCGTALVPSLIGSDDDYRPSLEASSGADHDDSSGTKDVINDSSNKETDVSNGLHVSIQENVNKCVPDDTKLTLKSSSSGSKRYFCLYCKKTETKFVRHLEMVHSQEEEVKKFMCLPVNDIERKKMIAVLRKKGIQEFNTHNNYITGKLMVCRRSNEKIKKRATDFTACASCKGCYTKSVFGHHFRKCSKRTGKHGRIAMTKGRQVAGRVHSKANVAVKLHIIPYMKEDDVLYAIRFDELIILFANKECARYGMHQHQYQMVRSHLRYLGRFLIAIKKIKPQIDNFSNIYQPKFYDSCIAAVKRVAGFYESTLKYKTPSVATNIGTLLKKVGELYRSECIKSEMEKELKLVQDFLNLLKEDFGTSVNKVAYETQQQLKRQKKVVLPSSEDILKLHSYLLHERRSAFSSLNKGFSYRAWRILSETTLVSIQLFNRRRAGEIERVLISDFNTYEGICDESKKDLINSLSIESQNKAKEYVRFMIRGKKGRGVPVLLDSELLKCCKLVEKYRNKAKVSTSNPYLFGVYSNDGSRPAYLHACILLRKFSKQCGAEIPTSLRGTELRKHIATKCIQYDVSENEVTDLANFMGLAKNIHTEIYRQPIIERDILKMLKLLEVAEGTTIMVDKENSGSSCESDPGTDEVCDKDIPDICNKPSTKPRKQTTCMDSKIDDTQSYEAEEEQFNRKKKKRNTVKRKRLEDAELPTEQKCASYGNRHFVEQRRSWGMNEKEVVLKAFGKYLKTSRFPSLSETKALIQQKKCLAQRKPAQIISFLHKKKKSELM